ncbi:marine proteobacterial sortase target protein [Neptunicella sp. SCSIO 80796]|uniref:marine proteobacterial sortase target protein n=1 Tax=Neptunicella plasticusilytica TaxID=3117012 RepID=UPI003A4E548E
MTTIIHKIAVWHITSWCTSVWGPLILGLGALFLAAPCFSAGRANMPNVDSIQQLQQGSLVLQQTNNPQQQSLSPLLHTDVRINVTGMVARTTVTQTFRNPDQQWVNGIYVFPLPENAAVDHMSMQVGDRIIVGEIQPKQQARETYQKAKQQGKKASLVEQQRPNLFTNSVANIGPDETVKVTIEYQQQLDYQNGQFSLRFPMTITPRYIPGRPISPVFSATGWALNTDQVPDASLISPPIKDRDSSENKVDLQVTLNSGFALSRIESEFHPVDITYQDDKQVKLELQRSAMANRDFVLNWQPELNASPQAALFTQQHNNKQYGLLMFMPPQPVINEKDEDKPDIPPREVIFVLDTSGSMAGESIRQAKMALQIAIQQLNPQDNFNLIEFNSNARSLWWEPMTASTANKLTAMSFIGGLNADGGTEMAKALHLALDEQYPSHELRQVIFITDGSVGNEQALMQLIEQKLAHSRLFTVGIGSAPNSYFMTGAAQAGRGTFTYIGDVGQVRTKMQLLLDKLRFPALTDIELDFSAGTEFYPAHIPDLYLGEPVMVSFRSDNKLNKLNISGNRQQTPWAVQLPVTQGAESSGLDVLWARNKIAQLNRDRRHSEDRQGMNQQIEQTALQHHLVSEFTSLVAVDHTPVDLQQHGAHDRAVANHLPQGIDAAEMMVGQLPQTATPASLNILTGILLLILICSWHLLTRRKNW